MKPFTRVAVPMGVVTATAFAPSVPAGVTAVILVALTTVYEVAATPPILTEVVPVRLAPVIVIVVPPVNGPVGGATDEIDGGAMWLKPLASDDQPPGVVTEIGFTPAVSAGVTAVIFVAFTTTTEVASFVPILTEVAPVKFVPVIVIAVPPVVGPKFGVTEVTVGGGK